MTMPSHDDFDMLHHTPALTSADAERLARQRFGVPGAATALTSERDQNFLITPERGGAIVIKIANAAEEDEFLQAQHAVLEHLAVSGAPVPRLIRALDRRTMVKEEHAGRSHAVWAVGALPGRLLSGVPRRSTALHADVGGQIARLDRALAGFDHPAIHRDFYWDLANARSIVSSRAPLLGGEMRAAVERIAMRFDERVAPLLGALPRSAVHGDLNDNNLLVGGGDDIDSAGQRVTGILDFGDMVYSYRVADLAIAIAYLMLGRDDPLVAAAEVVRGFTRELPLEDDEIAALFGFAALRLCASACIAAEQRRRRPENIYLSVSQDAIERLLPELARTPSALAEALFRQAAGMVPVPASGRVIDFLSRAQVSPVLGVDLRTEPTIVLDLGVSSPLLSGNARENDEPSLTGRVFGAMREAGVSISIGRYDEPRLLYVTPEFALGPRAIDEHRTIHIGLDLFAEPGTPVHAPLDGVVHAFHDNATLLDYGPVIILRHGTDDGTPFFTLYGHLSRESLAGLSVGMPVRAGDRVAWIGSAEVNVGWTPHLHLQVIVDLLGLETDFPGVARPSQRSVWTALSPDPNLITRVPRERFPAENTDKRETLDARRKRIGGNLSIAYRDPVRIVRGWMQYLYDDDGRCYIDAYNNVPHVGHCHPRVVEAGTAQMRVLNTNTRYLNDLLAAYAERLLSTLPAPLEVCYFLNSASEANELALRLARAHTRQRDTIVLEAAYHGNTTSLIDISPYKHGGPGGSGAPDWVHVAPLPDDYRGRFKRGDPEAGAKYAESVGELVRAIERHARRPAAFIAETCPSVGGQLVLPHGYLAHVYEYIRAAGGVCIADEVQTGLGRIGTSFWAFQDQGVIPDIVVMGKPLGNGHPIGAVATTRAIADSFDNGMEFFSTFGGNTVSCAIGLAVLDVVRDEQLQEHARQVGDHLLAGLRAIAEREPMVGDVRGSGLFLGVELVRDRDTLEPAGKQASFVANRMRERGVLLGTDGPHHNVIKIRPPMPFAVADADVLLEELEQVIAQIPR
jgi:4-aminobutyrate aminotransferase-like enzyme/Ser/Thr protein kinase RdoA (MazF antagonist)